MSSGGKKRIGLYPGTFDPVTLGHLDIIKRAVKLVDTLVIGVAINAAKDPMFSLDERVAMLEAEAAKLAAGRAVIAEAGVLVSAVVISRPHPDVYREVI